MSKTIFEAWREIWRALLAEFIGTLFLVLVGCGSTISLPAFNEKLTSLEIAVCFGVTVGVLIHALGYVSGCHINPAVTVGMIVSGNINILTGVLYIIMQLAGAIAGAALLFATLPAAYRPIGGVGVTSPDNAVNTAQAIVIEFLITFFLVFSVFMVMVSQRARPEPIIIGLVVAVSHIWAIKFTGSSMNPARSFGPALISNQWNNHWVYWVGPIPGGIVASLLYRFIFASNVKEVVEEEAEPETPIVKDAKTRDNSVPLEKRDNTDIEAHKEAIDES